MNNEVLKAIKERRSIRRFKPEQVTDEELQTVLEAGTWAATGHGTQAPWIVAVQNEQQKEQLIRMNATVMGVTSNPYYDAPTIVLVFAPLDNVNNFRDGSLVLGNMMLAAHSLGLGSIWIHRAKEEFETEEYQDLLKELGIEGEWEGIGHCALGYMDCELPAPPQRKDGRVYWIE